MVNEKKSLSYYASQEFEESLKEVKTTLNGLSQEEADRRLVERGYNVLVEEKGRNVFLEFIKNFKNPLVLILLVASVVSFSLGQMIDGFIVIIIVLASVALNFYQEYTASQAAEKLKETMATLATVIRDGKEEDIKIEELTVGDIVVFKAGDLIPADSRIIHAKDFFVNQSSLTGESLPVEKTSKKIDSTAASLSDLTNIVFTGSNVETGTATVVVVETGKDTEFGKIAKDLSIEETESEFSRGIVKFSYLIMRLTIFIVLAVFLINSILKQDVLQSFLFAIAVAVGLTPELLPMIMSVNMSKGSLDMAKNGVIVKKLNAIPNFGSMDILCTDKTGTLTQDKIALLKYVDIQGQDSEQVLLYSYLNSINQTGIKNPMDDAVVRFKQLDIQGYSKIDEIPFDFMRKKMSVVVEKDGKRDLITKGAPEEVFKSCASVFINNEVRTLDKPLYEEINTQYTSLSKEGYRVLAVGIKELHEKQAVYKKDVETAMTLLGFIAFLDPAKQDVKEVLHDLNTMGIEVKVITGDNELVTEKICKDVGLHVKGILLGYQIDSLTDDALRVVAEKTTIFARFSPDEKNRIITALKHCNHVIGYMGDGINDAPSLRAADVGISVNNAVDVAKESADIILTHKSLRELKEGVLEGRKTFGNTMKYIMMGISSNFGNMFSIIGAVLFLPFLPMLPIQILLNNLLYDVSQITIPSDRVDDEYIQTPKRWNLKFIKHFMYLFGPISSLFDFITFFVLYVVFHANAATFQTGWFLESLATQTLVIYIIRTQKIPFIESSPSKYLVLTTIFCLGVGWLLPFTFIGSFFQFVPLPLALLFSIVAIVLTYLIIVELVKRVFYKKYSL